MDWNSYRRAMDALPISEDFEARALAAALAVEGAPQEAASASARYAGLVGAACKASKAAPRRRMTRRFVGMAAAVAATFAFAVSAFAIGGFLAPEEVARELQDASLETAFAGSDAVPVGETQRVGDYDVTLEGLVTGENLSDWIDDYDRSATYAVVGLRRADGTPLTDEMLAAMRDKRYAAGETIRADEYYWPDGAKVLSNRETLSAEDTDLELVTCHALVQGFEGSVLSGYAADGASCTSVLIDGAYYLVAAVNDLSVLADRSVYLAVYEGVDEPASVLQENPDGSFSYRDGHGGALFELPLDSADADPEKAAQIVTERSAA